MHFSDSFVSTVYKRDHKWQLCGIIEHIKNTHSYKGGFINKRIQKKSSRDKTFYSVHVLKKKKN